ncbi:hypothetical protein [Miltoncostaea oceani]|uniref:hypothetical protein n=1 Tax=Miltoncostaea oceani TaxID=2843216 RepID=UPI001C3D59D3|nr:hypothetical protein [Miltoncostaea oceani]
MTSLAGPRVPRAPIATGPPDIAPLLTEIERRVVDRAGDIIETALVDHVLELPRDYSGLMGGLSGDTRLPAMDLMVLAELCCVEADFEDARARVKEAIAHQEAFLTELEAATLSPRTRASQQIWRLLNLDGISDATNARADYLKGQLDLLEAWTAVLGELDDDLEMAICGARQGSMPDGQSWLFGSDERLVRWHLRLRESERSVIELLRNGKPDLARALTVSQLTDHPDRASNRAFVGSWDDEEWEIASRLARASEEHITGLGLFSRKSAFALEAARARPSGIAAELLGPLASGPEARHPNHRHRPHLKLPLRGSASDVHETWRGLIRDAAYHGLNGEYHLQDTRHLRASVGATRATVRQMISAGAEPVVVARSFSETLYPNQQTIPELPVDFREGRCLYLGARVEASEDGRTVEMLALTELNLSTGARQANTIHEAARSCRDWPLDLSDRECDVIVSWSGAALELHDEPDRSHVTPPPALDAVLQPSACTHPGAMWREDQAIGDSLSDLLALDCPRCLRSRLAVIPVHRLPLSHPSRREALAHEDAYLTRQRTREALRGAGEQQLASITSIEGLAMRDGLADLSVPRYTVEPSAPATAATGRRTMRDILANTSRR